MLIKILATFILLLHLNNISFACSFNCGGTYTKNDEYGLKIGEDILWIKEK